MQLKVVFIFRLKEEVSESTYCSPKLKGSVAVKISGMGKYNYYPLARTKDMTEDGGRNRDLICI
jgi:hypothetical protein